MGKNPEKENKKTKMYKKSNYFGERVAKYEKMWAINHHFLSFFVSVFVAKLVSTGDHSLFEGI